MAEDKTGNESYSSKKKPEPIPEAINPKNVESVVEGSATMQKKPLGRRIAENMTTSDAQSVGRFIVFDVLVPRLRELMFDIIEGSARKTFLGDTTRGYTPGRTLGKTVAGYSQMFNGGATPKQAANAAMNSVPSDQFDEIILESRGDAQAVMDKASNLVETYGTVTVADLKAACGLTARFTDEAFGWHHMGSTDIRRVGGPNPGYAVIFPAPEKL